MTAPAWDRLFDEGDRRPGRWSSTGWRLLDRWEGWLTFGLTALMLFAVALSIEEANWVDEMPSLAGATGLGLVAGWVLLSLPGPAWARHLAGVVIGLGTVAAMTAQTLELSDPLVRSGPRGRVEELGERSGDWFDALLTGGISSDPVVFVLAVVAAAWAIAYVAAWAVGYWRNPWLALGPSGFVLLTNISYLPGQPSRWFVVFLFTAVLLFSHLYVLDRVGAAGRDDGAEVERPPFLSLEVLHATWWLGLVLVVAAWLVPAGDGLGPIADRWEAALRPLTDRTDSLGRLFVGVDSKRERRIHPFHDALPLEGAIEPTDDVLMYVEAPEPLYLRVAVFDAYSAAGWQTDFGDSGDDAPFTDELLQVGTGTTRAELRRPAAITVQVEATYQDRRLLSAGEPLGSDRAARIVTGGAPLDPVALEPERRLDEGDVYRSVGAVSAAPIEDLLTADVDYPAWVRERYLQLPDDLPPEVAQLGRDLVGAQPSAFVRARLIEAFLRQGFPIDTEITAAPPRRDAVAHFLFTLGRGYYDYHASAMTVLLRTVDVPARLAIGFVLEPGAIDPVSGAYIVSEQQAWAWTEVFFPRFGWVPFNPTPNRPPLVPPGDEGEFIRALGGIAVPGEIDPLNPSVADDELFQDAPDFSAVDALVEEAELAGARGPESRVGLIAAVVGAVVGAVVVFAGAGYWWWQRPFRGMSPAAGRWARILRIAGWAGVRLSEARTPLEAAAEVRRLLQLGANLEPLARAYSRQRYGPASRPVAIPIDREADPDRAVDHDERYRAARNELLRRWLGRALPRRGRAAGRPSHAGDAPGAGAG